MCNQSRHPEPSDSPTPTVDARRSPGAGLGGRRVAYYRCRCLVLEAALASLQRRLDRAEAELDEVVDRYEQILQHRDADGRVVAASRAPSHSRSGRE